MKGKLNMPISGHIDNFIAGIGVLAAGGAMNHRSFDRPHYDGNEPPDDGSPPPEYEKQAISKLWVKIVIGIALGGWSLLIILGVGFGHWFMTAQEDAKKQSAIDAAAISSQVKNLGERLTGPSGVCERLTAVETNQKNVMEQVKKLEESKR